MELFKRIPRNLWNAFKLYSYFYVGTNYVIPVGFVVCKGESMEPTINNNDVLITEKVSIRRQHLKNNDIIVFKHPFKSNKTVCKRVFVEGYEEYDDMEYEDEPYVSVVNVNVRGDNENNSHDSRDYGPIPYGLIESRAVLKIWPLTDFQFFKRGNK
ncbi:unnamed protein product [Brachionus calyciflorus]|uniref:Peptidase S26 domain-containing protein n=1 Tax=Brachionus calyciflorus TaxID=104777 RepID=A0A814BCN8_9BILA|nr:unnamed protein product [Brachionus calyciflorus]